MEVPAQQPRTLTEAVRYYSDERTCIDAVAKLRWADGKVACPKCGVVEGERKHYWFKTQKRWKCYSCRKQFSVKVGTPFEDSPLSLEVWLIALWMLCNCRNGVSSLVTRFSWYFDQPLMLFPALKRLIDGVDDPADLLEKMSRLPFDPAVQAEMLATTGMTPVGASAHPGKPMPLAKPRLLTEADYQQARADRDRWQREIAALLKIRPENWKDLIPPLCELERRNPRFKGREHILALVIPLWRALCAYRPKLQHPPDHYVRLIEEVSFQFPQPLMLLYMLEHLWIHPLDPAVLFERALREPFDPVWLAADTQTVDHLVAEATQMIAL